MKTLEERARYIAEAANDCCNRSDGFEEYIYKTALTMLQEAVAEAAVLVGCHRDQGSTLTQHMTGDA